MQHKEMPSYLDREAKQMAIIKAKNFDPARRWGAEYTLKHYNACDLANVIFKKRLKLVRMVYFDWGLSDNDSLAQVSGLPHDLITAKWVKKYFCYGESVGTLTSYGMDVEIMRTLSRARAVLRQLEYFERPGGVPSRWVRMMLNWVSGFFAILDTFGLLDRLLEDRDVQAFFDHVQSETKWRYGVD